MELSRVTASPNDQRWRATVCKTRERGTAALHAPHATAQTRLSLGDSAIAMPRLPISRLGHHPRRCHPPGGGRRTKKAPPARANGVGERCREDRRTNARDAHSFQICSRYERGKPTQAEAERAPPQLLPDGPEAVSHAVVDLAADHEAGDAIEVAGDDAKAALS